MTTPVTELVTLVDAVAHLNLDSTADLSELQGFIDAATAYIQNFTGPIVGRTFVESYDGGGPTVCLNNPPIASITSVVEYVGPTAYPLTATDLSTDGGAYSYSLDSAGSGVLRRRYNGNIAGRFAAGSGNVVVTYVAGMTAVPADIRMAVLQDIAGLYQPSQLGPAGSDYPLSEDEKPNPIGMFPRVAEILSQPVTRVPAIG